MPESVGPLTQVAIDDHYTHLTGTVAAGLSRINANVPVFPSLKASASDLGQYPTLPMVCFIKAAVPSHKKLHIGA